MKMMAHIAARTKQGLILYIESVVLKQLKEGFSSGIADDGTFWELEEGNWK